jgi:hypothetical protein
LRKIRRNSHIQQSTLPLSIDLRHALNRLRQRAVSRHAAQSAWALRH